jgi:hypothetical protein
MKTNGMVVKQMREREDAERCGENIEQVVRVSVDLEEELWTRQQSYID